MKSYIQGMITGIVFAFAIMVFMGGGVSKEVGRYKDMGMKFAKWHTLDTKTGEIIITDSLLGN